MYMFMSVNLQKWVANFRDPTTPMPMLDASISLLRSGHVRVIKKRKKTFHAGSVCENVGKRE